MTSFNELVIGSSQGFAFLLKIITEVFQDYVHLQGHGLAMISHKCEPSVSKEFNLFSVVDFYCLCVCHSNSPTVCSALKNGHLLCRIEHFHFLDGILTSLCIFYSLLFTVLSLSWTVCRLSAKFPDTLQSVRTVWKISGHSGMFPYNQKFPAMCPMVNMACLHFWHIYVAKGVSWGTSRKKENWDIYI